jgi:4-hydroxy-tetrahydrodipicolinate reductase
MTPVRAVITGVAGRMGSALVQVARDSGGVVVVGGTARKGSAAVGQDAGAVARLGRLEIPVLDDLAAALERGGAQVVIDFTSAQASVAHARICARRGVALVLGSTGLSEGDRAEVEACARQVPIVMAPNMSVGVNVMFKAAAELARMLGEGFDVEILEAHHRMKKDAPSGTALRLAEGIAQALGRDSSDFTLARQGQVGARPPREIGLQTLRGGDVVGEHTVFFFGAGERVELTHRASSRDQFAKGAVRAATWLVGRPPGLYDMGDVLGFKS